MLVYQWVFHYKWPMKSQHEIARSWGFSATLGDLGDKDCCESIRDLGTDTTGLPSGKHTKNHGKPPFLMGKSTISMAIFNSYVKLPEGIFGRSLRRAWPLSRLSHAISMWRVLAFKIEMRSIPGQMAPKLKECWFFGRISPSDNILWGLATEVFNTSVLRVARSLTCSSAAFAPSEPRDISITKLPKEFASSFQILSSPVQKWIKRVFSIADTGG